MKKTILATMVALASLTAKSQTVNDVPLKDINVEYLQIIGTTKAFTTKLTIGFDFGQNTKFFNMGSDVVLKDEKGEKVVFNSMIDALNFMSKDYTLVVATTTNFSGGATQFHYILKRKSN